VLFAALFLLCVALLIRRGQESVRLHDQILRFLNGEISSPAFSVRDDRFALFENAVLELEARLLTAGENRLEERKSAERLIVDISHQLKTPIAGLRLYCEMDAGAHEEQELQLLARMEHLIASLLRLERLRADGYEFQFEVHELSDVAREAASKVAPLFPARRIEITGAAQLSCDKGWMGEAFTNLIKNACEHTGSNGKIEISFEQAEGEALCVFQDDGGGVPPSELPRLFTRFFRSSASVSPDGAGVGLAIVRAVVEKHHGTVSAENARGGLCVTLCLPVLHHRLKKT
jgi:signal transduction histidine kinase